MKDRKTIGTTRDKELRQLKDSGIELFTERWGKTIFFYKGKRYEMETNLFDIFLAKLIRMGFI